jgi:hypothetical protein
MMTVELRQKLINKIKETQDDRILEEVYRLLNLEADDFEVYKLNDDQKKAIEEGRQQIANGQFLTDEQANNEIDEWLKK